MFWRKKGSAVPHNETAHQEPAIEPMTGVDPELSADMAHELNETEIEVIEGLGDRPLFDPGMDDVGESPREVVAAGGWLSRLTQGLTKTSAKLGQGLVSLATKRKLDAGTLAELEEMLIAADLGPHTAQKIMKQFAQSALFGRDVTEDEVRAELARLIADILKPVAKPLVVKRPDAGPFVMLVCGVNGVGKTTTIGKLAKIMHDQKHHRVMLAAGDTFRAAAVEQLQIWGNRAHCPVVTRDIGADSAALAYESYVQAKNENIEVLMIDTAGRLHNKTGLMDELGKIVRVLKKHGSDLPHEVLLVLDGTTGQNAFAQVAAFKEMVNVTGLIVTKLDGSAKGGVVVGLADTFGLPIYAVGVGEGAEDLQPFTADGFARALVGLVV